MALQGHMSNILLLDNRSWFWSLASSSQSLGMELFRALYTQLYWHTFVCILHTEY